MAQKYRRLGNTILCAAMLLGATPGVAQATTSSIPMNPNAGITKLWKTNTAKYGQPVSKENCVPGKGCEQVFENSVITWNTRTGVKALTGADRVAAYVKAGGIGTVGALESDAWNNTFCGPVVSTWDGATRHLVIVAAGKGTAGSSIDLNSATGKDWLANRGKTGKCFTDVTPTQPDTTPDAQKAQTAISAIKVYEYRTDKFISFNPGAPTGELTQISEDLYTQTFANDISAIFSKEQNKALYISTSSLRYYLKDVENNGNFLYRSEGRMTEGQLIISASFTYKPNPVCGPTWYGGKEFYTEPGLNVPMVQNISLQTNGGTCVIYEGELPTPLEIPSQYMPRTAEPNGIVDTTFDWSQASFISLQKVLEFYDVKTGDTWYIKADENGNPLPGAKPVKSNSLRGSAAYADRMSDYGQWAGGGRWNTWDSLTALGAPVGPEIADGQIVTQEFEGGTLTWWVGTEHLGATLNDLGQAKLNWYNSFI
ncbi:MAG: hypothetical protein Q3974_07265 [Rothia sp. (in: high G+C Gram-positive bacteria)]|nr:hypothetical protein [Rothia sp. (in: high G+C Gram-positive bacteria)]